MAVERHINFFELEKAAGKPGCPLCRIVAGRAERYMDNLLFEHVSDRAFRAAYRVAGGFCAYHSRHLESFRDGLAVAILGRDILEDRLEAFATGKFRKPKAPCPVCLEQDRIETEYLGFLAGSGGDGRDEDDLRAVFTASDGLCAPHYERLRRSVRTVPPWIVRFQEGRFRELLARTERFIELSAYGRQEEFSRLEEKDKVVWKELAVILRGTTSFH
jgi:hypothetical protein